MKTKFTNVFLMLALLATIQQVIAQGTAFTYQGRLNNGNAPANGRYDLTFSLFSGSSGGSALAGPLNTNAVAISNGLFTVTLDFGNQFPGANRWLEIGVRTNGSGAFTTLAPRQELTPTPYALLANTANNLASSVQLSIPGFTIQTNTSNAPNLIGGSSVNSVSSGVIGATISGGGGINPPSNRVTANFGTVSGGIDNISSGLDATVGGGEQNTASGQGATVSGGQQNAASGFCATVSGGGGNLANGSFSFAAGANADAANDGSFVWADESQFGSFSSTANNQFLIRAAGGVGINVNNPNGASLYVRGNRSGTAPNAFLNPIAVFENTSTATGSSPALRVIVDGGDSPSGALTVSANGTGNIAQFGNNTAFVVTIANDGTIFSKNSALTSDRNAKENFASLDAQAILRKVAALPLTEWNYKTDSKGVQHIGPMAQDFHAAFDLNGADDKHISVVDEGGVALAAIQGLNQKLEETRVENTTLKHQNDLLAERLNELEATVKQLAAVK